MPLYLVVVIHTLTLQIAQMLHFFTFCSLSLWCSMMYLSKYGHISNFENFGCANFMGKYINTLLIYLNLMSMCESLVIT